MKRLIRRLKNLLCYILIISMVIPSVGPMGSVSAASNTGLNLKKATILVGEEVQLSLTGDTIKDVSSSNNKIAVVNKNGVVTGKKAGTAKVTVTGSKGKKYKCTVKVKVGLSKKKLYVTNGQTVTLKLMGSKVKKVTSKNKKIVAVSKKNNIIAVKAKSKGTAKIKVKGKNRRTYTCTVIVETPSLSSSEVVLAKGDTTSIKLKDTKQEIKWTSAKSNVADISESGVVTGVAAGSTNVYAYDESNKKYKCHVKIEDPQLSSSKLYLNVEQSLNLTLTGNTQDVTWSSSRDNIVSVDKNGKITAVSNGEAKVTAKVKSGAAFDCVINVTDKANDIRNAGDNKDSDGKDTDKKSDTDDDKKTDDNKDADTSKDDNSSKDNDSKPEEKADDKDNKADDPDKENKPGEETSEDKEQSEVKKYYVNFVTIGAGDAIDPIEVKAGTKIGELPVPVYNEDKITFVGYFYDEECTKPAADDDEINSILILYVKTEEVEHTTVDDALKITAASDVGSDFKIVVNSRNTALTSQDVYDKIKVTNISHSEGDSYQLKQNNISVEGSDGVYTVTGKHILIGQTVDGFEAGADYKLYLPEVAEGETAELTFADYPDSVREFDIGIVQKEQNNMALANDVLTVSVDKLDGLYDENGAKLSYIDGSFYTLDAAGNKTENMEYSGYFRYSGKGAEDIKVGSSIALYSGMDPAKALKDPESFDNNDNNHIAYLSITRIEGDKYYYGNAAIEDIIKTPEVLPIPADADLKNDDKDNTLEIPTSYLDWSDDIYAQAKLDSQTKLDEGDFIALYSGTYGTDNMKQAGSFAEVIDIKDGGTYTDYLGEEQPYVVITTKTATLSTIADSAETNYSRSIDIYDQLSDAEKEQIVDDIEEDARTSGFVEEAGEYLAKAALATDSFKSLEGVENIDNYKFTVLSDNLSNVKNAAGKASDFYSKYNKYSRKYEDIMETYKQFGLDDEEEGNVRIRLEDMSVDLTKAKNLPGGLGANINVVFNILVKFPPLSVGSDDDGAEGGEEGGDDSSSGSDSGSSGSSSSSSGGSSSSSGSDSGSSGSSSSSSGGSSSSSGSSSGSSGSSSSNSGDSSDSKDNSEKLEDAEKENNLKIRVSATFTQEVKLDMGFGASVEWKTIGFIPYPSDIVFKPSFTTGTYTGIKINATIATAGKNDGMGSMLGDATEMYTDISDELKSLMEEDGEEDDEESEDIANWLSLRYSQMLETEHDAISLVEQKLFEAKYDAVPGVVTLGVELRLVVTVDAVVSLGIEFYNKQCKKTVYKIHVLKGKCDCETVEIIPPELDFKFYVMGFLEIRAGFEVELYLELLEGVLGKASLTIGVGAYVEIRGFFYYHIHVLKGVKTTNSAGALYVELGIYLEVGLGASVGKNYKKIKGKIAEWGTTLYENKWPIKKFGKNEVPFNFELRQEKYEDIEMHQYVTRFTLPDEYYMVNTLALDAGDIKPVVYDNKCYKVELSNPAFAYDEESHAVYLKDGFVGMETSCDVTLKYVNGNIPLSYAKMIRKFKVTWDNYLDGYAITPFSEGGSYVAASVGKYGAEVKKPKDPTKIGYVFDGWYTKDGEKYTYPATMPAENVSIYAHWNPATDTRYTVYYYLEDNDNAGSYVCDGKKTYKGTTGETVSPEPKEYKNYVTPSKESVEILADGSAVIRYYYDLIRGTDTFKTGEHGRMADVKLVTKVGSDVHSPEIAAAGYEFVGWKNVESGQMITAEELSKGTTDAAGNKKVGVIRTITADDCKAQVYEAQWTERTDIGYRVEYYVQQPSGAYTVQAVGYGQGKSGAEVDIDTVRNAVVETTIAETNPFTGAITEEKVKGKADELFTEKAGDEEVLSYDYATVDGQPVSTDNPAKIKGDGSLVIKIRYKRKACTVSLKSSGDGDDSSLYTDYSIFYGAKMALPVPEKPGYTFIGYKDESGKQVETDADTGLSVITVTGDVTYTSMGWTAGSCTLKYDADGGVMTEPDTQTMVIGSQTKLNSAPEKNGYIFAGWKNTLNGKVYQADETVETITTVIDEVVTLKAMWELKGYSVTYDADGGTIDEGANPSNYNEFSENRVLVSPTKTGYTFDGWYDGSQKITVIPGDLRKDMELKAKWTARTDISYVVNHYKENVDGNGKTLVSQETLAGTTGDKVTPEVTTFEGFTSPEAQTVTVAGDGSTTVDYVYTRNHHTVSIDLDGGSIEDEMSKELAYGENLTEAFATPQMENYVFAGWLVDDKAATTVPDHDIVMKATWICTEQGSVTFNHYQMDMDGKYTILADSETVVGDDGEEVTAQVKEYEGFEQPEAETVILEGASAKEVRLKYKRKKYDVTWDLAEGKASGSYTEGTTYYGAAIVAPVPVKDNHTVVWDKEVPAVMGCEDLSFTAVWSPVTCKVTFDAGVGVVDDDELEKTVTYGEEYGQLPVPQVNGLSAEFTGWYDKAEEGNKVEADTVVSQGKDHILYARWKFDEMLISYEGLEGADNGSNPDKYRIGGTDEIYIYAPVKEGYTFIGWTDGSDNDPVTPYVISADSKEEITLTANWKENTYRLQLYGYSGLYFDREYKAGDNITDITLPVYTGYAITGWKNMGNNEVTENLPETMPGNNLVLQSQWEKVTYSLTVGNKQDEEVAEVTWQIGDNSIILVPPTKDRDGYDFDGWYTSDTFDEDSFIEKIEPVAHNITVYGKWTAKHYKANFYFNEGTASHSAEPYSEEMVFGESKAIKTATALGLSRNGYTFEGWALTQNATEKKFADGATIDYADSLDSLEDGIVNLYAVWKPIEYTISYISWDAGATANSSNNPTKYTINSPDKGLSSPTGIKAGCQFEGWYDEKDNKVTSLKLKGETGNKTLKAKWTSPGSFSISLVSSTSASPVADSSGKTDNNYTTFKITRTMPTGVAVADAQQRIYYRTINGTAIGGTASPINFKHVGGQNTYALFSKTECYSMENNQQQAGDKTDTNGNWSATFKVKNENVSTRYMGSESGTADGLGDYAHLYNLTGTSTRYYTAELYKIENATDSKGVTGTITTSTVDRTMTMPSAKILTEDAIYGERVKGYEADVTIDDTETTGTFSISGIIDKDILYYLKTANGSKPKFKVSIKAKKAESILGKLVKEEDTARMDKLEYKLGDTVFNYDSYKNNSGNVHIGKRKNKNTGEMEFAYYNSEQEVEWDLLLNNDTVSYAGKAHNTGALYYRLTIDKNRFAINVNDTRAPEQVGIAPMATSDYKKGDTVRFAVIYDELINSATGTSGSGDPTIDVSLDKIKTYLHVENVTYKGGVGTNVLVFEGKATEDFSNTTNSDGTGGNNAQLISVKPVQGNVKDIKGN